MRRLIAVGGAVALLATAGITLAGPATADDAFAFSFHRPEINLQPGEGVVEIGIGGFSGTAPDGTYAFALSSKPLDDPTWAGGGLPAGLTVDLDDQECKASATVKGVYLCDITDAHPYATPRVRADASAAHDTKLYYGLVYVPRGKSVADGVKEAQVAATAPASGTHAARTVTVKSAAHVAQNTLKFTAPDVPAGGTVTHTLAVHAVDKGPLTVQFDDAGEQRPPEWDEPMPEITSVSVGEGATCDHSLSPIVFGGGVTCEIEKPGDYTVTYALKAPKGLAAWKLEARASYDIYNWGTGNPEATGRFAVQSDRPVRDRFHLLARKPDGTLRVYQGSGRAPQVFQPPQLEVGGWKGYTALAKLGPLGSRDQYNGIVARDSSGVLWSYGTGIVRDDVGDPKRVGGGWNEYNALTGIGDANGDKKYDLVARNAAGALYFYEGTGNQGAPFKARTLIGNGWQQYNALTGLGDATGDGRGDLVARTAAGELYFYEGTGRAAAPFKPRVLVGKGWNMFSALVGTGDLNDDGRADLVGRDTAGLLWYYEGTGKPAAPYKARVRVGGGWNAFNALF
ncbi:FG-GAP-like repeat-containing protein [Streptomyces sp. NPDC087440]|uniref:FG-GAP-like repeat-containing protein n=1 Tax=Streptomyces sp. NPDC087440 TaxID=3365790 RepID=UPI00380A8681